MTEEQRVAQEQQMQERLRFFREQKAEKRKDHKDKWFAILGCVLGICLAVAHIIGDITRGPAGQCADACAQWSRPVKRVTPVECLCGDER